MKDNIIKVVDDTLVEGLSHIQEIWNDLEHCLYVDIEEDIEQEQDEEQVSNDSIKVIINDKDVGIAFLRTFGDYKVVEISFGDSDIWFDIKTGEMHIPSEWIYTDNFKILIIKEK